MNAGAVRYGGKVLLFLRVEGKDRETRFHKAWSEDGLHFEVETEPLQLPLTLLEERVGEQHHFDIRVTPLDGRFYLSYAIYLERWGSTIGMAVTDDFETYTTLPYTSEPANRNAALFPEKIGGYYARLDRPQDVNGNAEMWVSYSPDLEFWGRSMPLGIPRRMWNKGKNGAGCIPVRTEEGWLIVYHATASTCSSLNYYLGAALLDLEDPSVVRAAPAEFLLAAEEPYECVGQTPNVVFTCGAVEMPDGTLNLYYAGADTRLCLGRTTVEELLQFCLASTCKEKESDDA
jgi:beta-1,4-mannooligosaccharide/beta-1,4-mannosyl-N-acetylglucosamine phosphorylase